MTLYETLSLLISILTPLIVALAVFTFDKRLKHFEQIQWSQQSLIKKRLEFFEAVAFDLNEIMCYFCYIGDWKSRLPHDILNKKRLLDKRFFSFTPIIPNNCIEKYQHFMGSCFATFQGWGTDAKLRTNISRRRLPSSNEWDRAWDSLFEEKKSLPPQSIQASYRELIDALADSFNFLPEPPTWPRTRVPSLDSTSSDQK